jgi:glyoxylase-like metal-dependent hydrolase (beta-lactamase superfamily II)
MSNLPIVKDFFHEDTNTFSYVVRDPATKACAIIDSVLDYDPASASTSTIHADKIIAYIKEQGLTVEWILETHVHADHLTAAQYLKAELGGKIAMSQKIGIVQETFGAIYHLDIKQWNAQQLFDYLFEDHESFQIGTLKAYNIPTPGHTPACLSYVIGDAVFVGDTLFMPDYGTARCDFPRAVQNSFLIQYKACISCQKIHGYFYVMTICLKHVNPMCVKLIFRLKNTEYPYSQGISKAEFAQMRNQRDSGLSMPKLILPSIQINMKAGQFPEPEQNGVSYLKLPLNYFK